MIWHLYSMTYNSMICILFINISLSFFYYLKKSVIKYIKNKSFLTYFGFNVDKNRNHNIKIQIFWRSIQLTSDNEMNTKTRALITIYIIKHLSNNRTLFFECILLMHFICIDRVMFYIFISHYGSYLNWRKNDKNDLFSVYFVTTFLSNTKCLLKIRKSILLINYFTEHFSVVGYVYFL